MYLYYKKEIIKINKITNFELHEDKITFDIRSGSQYTDPIIYYFKFILNLESNAKEEIEFFYKELTSNFEVFKKFQEHFETVFFLYFVEYIKKDVRIIHLDELILRSMSTVFTKIKDEEDEKKNKSETTEEKLDRLIEENEIKEGKDYKNIEKGTK